jgi:arylsulfatase A-like enzyme
MTNLLLLLCDQLRADVLGCYGHPFAVTPAMDGLAARGTVYDRACTSSPVCVSARASLVFGAEPGETGCYDNGFAMPADRSTLMGVLSEAGYRTHGAGKMHFTPACVSFVDAQIARILAELPDDTMVVLSADHGEFLRDYGYLTRRWKYVWSAADRREYLIDRLHDPGETTNVATLPAIARDPDAGFLTIPDDDLAPEDTFAEYRHRYREGEKP